MQLSPGDGCGDFLILVQCVILQCSLFDINLEPLIEVKKRLSRYFEVSLVKISSELT